MSNYITEKEREAASRVSAILERPVALADHQTNEDFDPWELFPAVYGTYSSDFDKCAIDVLREIVKGQTARDDVGAEMFREMLCTSNLCNYGTSPRTCFPTSSFRDLLPALLDKWKEYAVNQWG